MSMDTIETTIAVEMEGFSICDLDVKLEYTYRPGSKGQPIERGHPYREPDEGPEVEFISVRVEGVNKYRDRKLFNPLPDLAKYLLETAQADDDLIQRVCLQEAEDQEMDDGR